MSNIVVTDAVADSAGFAELVRFTIDAPPSSSLLVEETLPTTSSASKSSKNIFYLAYGSNLSSATFQGRRGIRPLSSTNVHVPALSLSFSLPGIAYIEPRFANVSVRDASSIIVVTPGASLPPPTEESEPLLKNTTWSGGLIGVVYEVTPEDFRTIIATEGGGASYADVVVPTFPLKPQNTLTDGKAPILAHTLLAPANATRPQHAQASLRYLNLLRVGAREHSLPENYIAYLDALPHYHVTSWRQWIGRAVWMVMWAPSMIVIMSLSRFVADAEGHMPKWMARMQRALFGSMWMTYDYGWKQVFGDGERTEDGKDGRRDVEVEVDDGKV